MSRDLNPADSPRRRVPEVGKFVAGSCQAIVRVWLPERPRPTPQPLLLQRALAGRTRLLAGRPDRSGELYRHNDWGVTQPKCRTCRSSGHLRLVLVSHRSSMVAMASSIALTAVARRSLGGLHGYAYSGATSLQHRITMVLARSVFCNPPTQRQPGRFRAKKVRMRRGNSDATATSFR